VTDEPDPMDALPADHGSDRYDYVESQGGPEDAEERLVGVPWFEALIAEPCPDCRANVFLRWVGDAEGDPSLRFNWHVTYAHDETCPAVLNG
jgi:hypothetical protein